MSDRLSTLSDPVERPVPRSLAKATRTDGVSSKLPFGLSRIRTRSEPTLPCTSAPANTSPSGQESFSTSRADVSWRPEPVESRLIFLVRVTADLHPVVDRHHFGDWLPVL